MKTCDILKYHKLPQIQICRCNHKNSIFHKSARISYWHQPLIHWEYLKNTKSTDIQKQKPHLSIWEIGSENSIHMTFHRLLLNHVLNAPLARFPNCHVGLLYVWVLLCWDCYMQIQIKRWIRLKLFFSRPFSHFIFCLCIKLSIKMNTTNYKYLAKDLRCQLLFQVVIYWETVEKVQKWWF